ncbi:MAG: phosphatidate cytidylyltransferase [Burkholderiales bacterium]|nr:phosphatidate cytidylyltransferase [Burkholderiales bacterium]
MGAPMQPQLVNFFAGVFAVLLVASAVAWLLRVRVARGEPHAAIDNLVARVKAWWVMVAVLGLAFAFGKTGVVVLFGFVSFFALREFVSLSYTRRGDHWALAAAFFVFLPLQYVLVGIEWYGLYSILIPVYAFLTLPIFAALSADLARFFERTSKLQFALMVCVYCISHVPALMTLRIPGFEGGDILLIAWLVLVVQGSDVLQYVWGKLAGRRKIAPDLSPSKTVEGFAGGVASATIVGALLYWLTPFAPWQAAVIALVVSLMGFFGGLVMSAMKRDRGVKDWGTMIEGHGGMLDRLDSVIFAAPVYFHIVRYFWEP